MHKVFEQTDLSKQCRPDQTPQNVASDQVYTVAIHPRLFLDTSINYKNGSIQCFRTDMVKCLGVRILRVNKVKHNKRARTQHFYKIVCAPEKKT